MRNSTVTTAAAGFKYPLSYQVFESVDEARRVWQEKGHNPDEVLLGILNAAQKQGATQGDKTGVREAVEALTAAGAIFSEDGTTYEWPEDSEVSDEDRAKLAEALEKAVADHQSTAGAYVIGAPRGSGNGPTKKTQAEFGQEVTKRMLEKGDALSKTELADLAKEFGIVL